ncbi:MAG: glycosyltransferase family protein [Oceanococcus sp.]
MSEGKSWLVFGDDWGRHPSTTQHLIRHIPKQDSIYWIGSIGMRPPQLRLSDLLRVVKKLVNLFVAKGSEQHAVAADVWMPQQVKILLLPWHGMAPIRWLNQRLLARALRREAAPLPFDTLLISNPVAVAYSACIHYKKMAYLRLDDYALLPGVKRAWVEKFEPQIIAAADCVFATAQGLLPGTERDVYLPQGVDIERFSVVPAEPQNSRCVGFFGLMESWLNYPLIAQVAHANPAWTFEFIGHAPAWPEYFDEVANVRLLPAVDYQQLGSAITHWDAAWVPFLVNELTLAVNPIKLREYLAAGLPTLSTPLPESEKLQPWAQIAIDSDAVTQWLDTLVLNDSKQQRIARRQAMQSHTWQARSQQLRAALFADVQC